MISQLETSAPTEIFLEYKIPNGVYIFSGTRAIVTPERRILRKKSNMKSPAMSPPRKDTIPNQDNNRIINEQDTIIPPLL